MRNMLITAVAVASVFTAVAVASVFTAQAAAAQATLAAPTPGQGMWLEIAKPHFKEAELTMPSSVWYIGARLPIGDRLRLTADIPFSYAGLSSDSELGDESGSVIGNPFLGAEFVVLEGLTVDVGLRAPLTSADDSFAGLVAAASDALRAEAFVEDIVPVSGRVTYERPVVGNASVRLRGGVMTALYTGDDDDVETSTVADYGLFGSMPLGIARFGAGLSGRWDMTEDEGGFSENSVHELAAMLDVAVAGFRPGLIFRLPIDDEFNDFVDYTIGAYVEVPLN